MTAAEWRKRIRPMFDVQEDLAVLDALLRDFEAAEEETAKFVRETGRLVTLNDKLRENEMRLIARSQAEQQRREAADARVRELATWIDREATERERKQYPIPVIFDHACGQCCYEGTVPGFACAVHIARAALAPQERGGEGAQCTCTRIGSGLVRRSRCPVHLSAPREPQAGGKEQL
jgi:hypothetical protein